eukprot:CAMPEP_0201518466 /NCGR_PEP_ID=MMETSP0161_2-20130828/9310_1 /ASSEMBLY_ACC=CAM_ASM_000251 /TAXON_ID=180227 /ORGANISM="Neoparamoeba aestuarina, Strain SoJaBio B1-5/56/2" /LENGTH=723 /DNA_ID=CAMNT_0047916253 /DNA_START=99 /DNA_END=2270 /DNA_ORIENTATION=+
MTLRVHLQTPVEVKVYDWDKYTKNEICGTVSFTPLELLVKRKLTLILALDPKLKSKAPASIILTTSQPFDVTEAPFQRRMSKKQSVQLSKSRGSWTPDAGHTTQKEEEERAEELLGRLAERSGMSEEKLLEMLILIQNSCRKYLLQRRLNRIVMTVREYAKTPVEKSRMRVMLEIVDTEKHYIDNLRKCVDWFLCPIIEAKSLSKEEMYAIFGNFYEIYEMNQKFLKAILNAMLLLPNEDKFVKIFMSIDLLMDTYAKYIILFPHMFPAYERLIKRKKKMALFFERAAEEAGGPNCNLNSFLITPVQRLPRYQLLLREYLKSTSPERPTYTAIEKALERTAQVNKIINERKRNSEKVQAAVKDIREIAEVVGRDCSEEMQAWFGENIELLVEGRLKVKANGIKKSSKFNAFLFSKSLLLWKTKERKREMVLNSPVTPQGAVRDRLGAAMDIPEGEKIAFHVIPWNKIQFADNRVGDQQTFEVVYKYNGFAFQMHITAPENVDGWYEAFKKLAAVTHTSSSSASFSPSSSSSSSTDLSSSTDFSSSAGPRISSGWDLAPVRVHIQFQLVKLTLFEGNAPKTVDVKLFAPKGAGEEEEFSLVVPCESSQPESATEPGEDQEDARIAKLANISHTATFSSSLVSLSTQVDGPNVVPVGGRSECQVVLSQDAEDTHVVRLVFGKIGFLIIPVYSLRKGMGGTVDSHLVCRKHDTGAVAAVTMRYKKI